MKIKNLSKQELPREKIQKNGVVTMKQIEPAISKNPVVFPVVWIIYPMLPNVTRCVFKTTIKRLHSFQVKKS